MVERIEQEQPLARCRRREKTAEKPVRIGPPHMEEKRA
jgi:hypothetical protein